MRVLTLIVTFIFLATPSDVKCPDHGYATCYWTGASKMAKDGHQLKKYHCSCGDEWWVRAE